MTWVFLHGAASSPDVWAQQRRAFPTAVYYRFPPDPDPGDALLEYYRAAVLRDISGPLIIVGHSLGGAVAQLAMLTEPNRVAGAVLVGTGPRLPVNPELLAGLADHPGETLDRVAGWSLARTADASLLEGSRTMAREADPRLALRQFAACARFDLRGAAPAPDIPVEVIWGAADRMTPPALVAELAALWPCAHLVEIPNAGHLVMLEQPQDFNRALRQAAERHGWTLP